MSALPPFEKFEEVSRKYFDKGKDVTTWTPTNKQTTMLSSTASYILFGGSRGGGKTDAAIRWFLYDIHHEKFRGLVIRRNAKDLTDFVDRANQVWSKFGAKKTGNPAKFTFPSGAIIYTGHLGTEDAYTAYQGHEYHKILIEELTHIPTQELFEKLMGSLRSTESDIQTQFLATTNPGGPGHEWVKEYWKITDIDQENGKKFEEDGLTKLFVPANIEENRHLADADPKYVQFLKNLPPDLRAKWYEGSWEDIDTENQYYATRMTKLKNDGRLTIVPIESALRTFTAFDLGLADRMVLWTYQIMGREIRIVDCYSNRNEPLKHYSDYIKNLEKEHDIKVETLYVPHDASVRSMTSDTLMTRYEKLVELGHNVEMISKIGVNDGIDIAKELLSHCFIDGVRCKDGVRALRAYQKEFDEKMNRYKDKPLHDWASDYADSFRYLALSITKSIGGTVSTIAQKQKNLFKRRHR